MVLKVIILCCIMQSITGATIPNAKIKHQSIGSRIVGGRDAAEGEAPYQCSLQLVSYGHYCGCAIISAEYVVTAAHCLKGKNMNKVRIVVGINKLSAGGKHYKPEKFITHKSYNNPDFAYDIGLIRVQTPIKFNEKVQPIIFSKKFVEAGSNLMVTGWGYLEDEGRMPNNLQVLNVTSISNKKCKEKATEAHDSHLCTLSSRDKGICDGDSGGPLVCGNELVGLVNWSSFTCAVNFPDGYARISYLYDWIVENVNSM